jgi:starch synthase (maltosyl-transferring)
MVTALDLAAAQTLPRHQHAAAAQTPPRIYHFSPLLAGPLSQWDGHLQRAAQLGFSHLLLAPVFEAADLFAVRDYDRPLARLDSGSDAPATLAAIAAACARHGLVPLLDVMPDHVAADGRVAAERPDLFRSPDPARALDPRGYAPEGNIAVARYDDAAEALADWWAERLLAWHQAGMAGFRFASLRRLPPETLGRIASRLGPVEARPLLLGWTLGLSEQQVAAFAGGPLDFVFASLPAWEFGGDGLWAECARLRRVARVLAPVEAPFGPRLAARIQDPALRAAASARQARFAAALADGWLMPMGFEQAARDPLDARHDTPQDWLERGVPSLAEAIAAANTMQLAATPQPLTAPGAPIVAFLRDDPAVLRKVCVVVNARLDRPVTPHLGALLGAWQPDGEVTGLAPGELRAMRLHVPPPVTLSRPPLLRSAEAASRAPRISIEAVSPSVDGGRFAAKRLVGETLEVTVDVVSDGHEQLAVALLWQSGDETAWQERRMRPLGNDRWTGEIVLSRIGRWLFTIEAWRDTFATFRDELAKKHTAGLDVTLELAEGREMVAAAAERVVALRTQAEALTEMSADEQVRRLLSEPLAAQMAAADPRPFAVRLSPPRLVDADRMVAQFGSWYELFPRSMSDDPHRHGTFRDVIRHLPRVRDMGFDVLYFPPIHPVGQTNRKGRNNTLHPAADDPGSPYAIGGAAGGHDAIEPALGTLEDFRALREAAEAEGLELALDFAVQCSPDHPWLRQHREWFDWRPDGSLKYAENPPKKYEDIVNVDFYAPGAVPDLWVALCEVVLFWAGHGVRIFRVDNPHTKPFPFWEWLIAEVRAAYPDTIFLAEAFTRPKVMQRLAKLGFSQSYTYFTWRNTPEELRDYLTELTAPGVADILRPNFFVNTPDINPVFLQTSGRSGFLIRAALAATLSGAWGVYCGFELCEGAALPGREEYADSEKYQIRAWDWHRPGNIVAEITALNGIRRRNPALHTHLGLRFLASANPQVLAYEKATADRGNVVLAVVSLDPFEAQSTDIDVPLWRWGLHDGAGVIAEDLLAGTTERWQGRWRHVPLAAAMPFRLWRLHPAA